jgi:hypothetical protein
VTPGITAMLLGVFIVPVLLLWLGHRLRRRPAPLRGAFWGAIVGHVVAILLGLTFGMIPPEEWSSGDRLRGALGLWSFLVLPAIGAAIGWLRARHGA